MIALEVKICGLTRPDEAAVCAEAGAAAIGLVFHPASPRHLEPVRAREIVRALPPSVPAVAVFAGVGPDHAARTAEAAGASIIQLHGREPASTIAFLLARGFGVIRTLHAVGSALVAEAARLPPACALLVECGTGPLPGGNGADWDWGAARPLAAVRPFALAGGLTPDNAAAAVAAAGASALDLSSGVESAPGRKNLEKVIRLFHTLSLVTVTWPTAPVFGACRPKGRSPCPDNR